MDQRLWLYSRLVRGKARTRVIYAALLCGALGVMACDGPPGEPGAAALLDITDEPPGEHCPYGGVSVLSGIDADGDGALDSEEVTATAYLCDGGSTGDASDTEINVRDFGAVGDDESDDSAAFAAATATLAPWGTLRIPPGQYRLAQPWIVDGKHRTNIVSQGVLKPHTDFTGEYLVEVTNTLPDSEMLPSMGAQMNLDGLTLDCEWRSRGIKLSKLYDSSVTNLEVWRPYGTGVFTPMLQEVSFIQPIILGARPRFDDAVRSAPEWDGSIPYAAGALVRRSFNEEGAGPWSPSECYQLDDIVAVDVEYSYPTGGGTATGTERRAYRCTRLDSSPGGCNLGRDPTDVDHGEFWERIPVQYFEATAATGNLNRDPWDGGVNNTTRQAPTAVNRFWRPVYADEAAWSMVGSGALNTIDNVKVWNFISRSNATTVVLRIDNTEAGTAPLKIEFHAAQLHAITAAYVRAFNDLDVGWKIDNDEDSHNDEVLRQGRLVELLSSSGFKLIGGQVQLGNVDGMKGLLVGTPGTVGNNAGIGLIGSHFEGIGAEGRVRNAIQLSFGAKVLVTSSTLSVGDRVHVYDTGVAAVDGEDYIVVCDAAGQDGTTVTLAFPGATYTPTCPPVPLDLEIGINGRVYVDHGFAAVNQVELSVQRSCDFFGRFSAAGTDFVVGGQGSQATVDPQGEI